MFTGKQFTKHIFFLIGDHPYTWAKEKGIKRSVIGQLKRERIPGPKILNQLAVALGTDVNYLLSGKKTPISNGTRIKERVLPYQPPQTDWQALLDSLDYNQWQLAGRPERRKEDRGRSGKSDRRKLPHEYLERWQCI